MSRRGRALSREEKTLWDWATRDVALMKGRKRPSAVPIEEPPALKPKPEQQARRADSPRIAPQRPAPLREIEAPVKRKLKRGRMEAGAVLDLHGMRQAEAHLALIRFIERCHRDGEGLALVITGKGGRVFPGAAGGEETGVIRRMVPHWLADSPARDLVIGFESAAARHGGEGALYIRIRKPRGV